AGSLSERRMTSRKRKRREGGRHSVDYPSGSFRRLPFRLVRLAQVAKGLGDQANQSGTRFDQHAVPADFVETASVFGVGALGDDGFAEQAESPFPTRFQRMHIALAKPVIFVIEVADQASCDFLAIMLSASEQSQRAGLLQSRLGKLLRGLIQIQADAATSG